MIKRDIHIFIGKLTELEELGYEVTQKDEYYLCQKDKKDFLIIKENANGFMSKNEIFSCDETHNTIINELLEAKLIKKLEVEK